MPVTRLISLSCICRVFAFYAGSNSFLLSMKCDLGDEEKGKYQVPGTVVVVS